MSLKDLEKHLHEWQSHGLLSAEQVDRIRAYEDAHAPASRLRLALTLIAVFSMGLGVISLIAANWDQIPAWFKLASYFLLMGLQALGLVRWDQAPGWRREGLHFFYILFLLAGIALIAQTFHVPSGSWKGMALWSALSLGIMLRARSWYTVLLWYGSFVWAWLAFMFEPHFAFPRLETFLLVTTLLSIVASWSGRSVLPEPQRSVTLGRGALPEPQRSVTLALTCGFILLAAPWFYLERKAAIFAPMSMGLVLAMLWLFVLSRRWGRASMIAATAVAVGFFARWGLISSFQDDFHTWPNFLETLAFLLEMTALSVLALQRKASRLFDALTLLMAARIFSLFITLFGTLLTTGAGLIFFGALVLGLLHLWYRYRERLQSRLEEFLS